MSGNEITALVESNIVLKFVALSSVQYALHLYTRAAAEKQMKPPFLRKGSAGHLAALLMPVLVEGGDQELTALTENDAENILSAGGRRRGLRYNTALARAKPCVRATARSSLWGQDKVKTQLLGVFFSYHLIHLRSSSEKAPTR